MRDKIRTLLWMFLGGFCLAAVCASGAEPALSECFPAKQLKLPQHQVEKTFAPASNRANFTAFQGITNIQVDGDRLRFTLTAGRATMGWGNYQGTQTAPEIASLWEQRNDVALRVRQSGTNSSWTMIPWADGARMRHPQSLAKSLSQVLVGTNWSDLLFRESTVQLPAPDGFEFIITGRRGDVFEISQMQIIRPTMAGVCRREIVLPTGKVWRAVAMVAPGMPDGIQYPHARMRAPLFVNGREVPRRGPVYGQHAAALDLAPFLKPGTNCFGFEYYGVPPNAPTVYLQMKVILASGETISFQTDDSWKAFDGVPPPAGWNEPGFDDSLWTPVQTQEYVFRPRSYFDGSVLVPEHDGLIVISNPLRDQLYYTDQEEIQFDIALPPGLAGKQPALEYEIGRAGADGLSSVETAGKQTGFVARPDSLVGRIAAGRLAGGVYTVALTLKVGGEIIEQRPREPFMVIRKLDQKIVPGADYTDGLDLELEDSIDFASPADSHPAIEWVARYGKEALGVEQPRLIRRDGLAYREGADGLGSGFSFRLNPFRHPGDFYLMELEYPDDAERDFVVTVASKFGVGADAQTGVGVGTGGKYRLTHRPQKLYWLHVADSGVHSIDIVNCSERVLRPAAACSLKIHHVKGDLPAVAFGANRMFGTLNERCYYDSGHGLNFGVDTPRILAAEQDKDKNWPPLRRFIQDLVWMQATADKYTQYLKFAGQNTHMIGVWQYNRMNTGLVRDYDLPTSRIVPCLKRVMARTFDVNNIKFGASVQLMNFDDIATLANNAQVAQGADTVWAVNSKGEQLPPMGAKRECINWVHPLVQERFYSLIGELAGIFDLPNFTGVHLMIGTPDLLYPYKGGNAFTEALNIYDDYSFAAFERDTGTRLPFDNHGPNRFARRAVYLADPGNKAAFRAWRCQAAFNLVDGARKVLQARRGDLGVMCGIMGVNPVSMEYWDGTDLSFHEFMRGFSIDPALFDQAPGIWLGQTLMSWSLYGTSYGGRSSHRNADIWRQAADPAVYDVFNHGDARYAFVMVNQAEISVSAPGHKAKGTSGGELAMGDWVLERYKIRANGQPSGESAREVFIQALLTAEPDRLLYGFSDINLPIGHEQELREFARVFTALPRGRFVPVLDTGLLSNIAIRVLRREDAAYFYAANPTPLRLNAILEIDSDQPVLPLAGGEALKIAGGSGLHKIMALELPPFGLAAGKSASPNLEIRACKVANPPESELTYFTDIRGEIRGLLADQSLAGMLDQTDREFFDVRLAELDQALADNEYGRAYAILTQHRFWRIYREELHNCNLPTDTGMFLIDGWQVSKIMEEMNSVSNAPCVGLDQDAGWRPIPADDPASGRIGVHAVYPPGHGDGVIYLACRIKVRLPGKYWLRLGHDGGARLFWDGQPIACDPKSRPPITPDRTQAELDLTAGEHELVVAFDLNNGNASGIRFRFAKADGQPIRVVDFPSPIRGN